MATEQRIASLVSRARGIIFDLDGTLISGHIVLPGAAQLLAALTCQVVVASNNSSDTAVSLSRRLALIGLDLSPDRLILAGELALGEVARRFDGAEILLVASPTLQRHARALGLRTVSAGGDVVLVCRDERFDYDALAAAANSVRQGARLMAANPDLSHPGPHGDAVPETGSLVAAIAAVAGSAQAEFIGKPHPLILRHALAKMVLAPQDALVIGDNPATDGKGARDHGIPFLEVGTAPSACAATPADILRAMQELDLQPVSKHRERHDRPFVQTGLA